jgi:hypothetical protein
MQNLIERYYTNTDRNVVVTKINVGGEMGNFHT